MTFPRFMDAFNYDNQRYNFKECGMLIHFRIATHGARDATMTHPFPIQYDDGALCKSEYISDYAVIHNGIISLTSDSARKSNGLSDTAVFVKDYLSLIAQNRGWFKRTSNLELIEKLIDSKMAIMNNKGEIISTRGFTEDNGVFYSNTSYKENYYRYGKMYSKGSTVAYSMYDNYDDYYAAGYDWTANYNKNKTSGSEDSKPKDLSVISTELMQTNVGETIEYNGFTQLIDSSCTETYWIDRQKNVWITDEIDENSKDDDSAEPFVSYYLLGTDGCIYTSSNAIKTFRANRVALSKQFPEI